MNQFPIHARHPLLVHRVECVHQPEIEIWPAWAEAYFADERYSDPASSQVRFDAIVYNTPSRAVLWGVQAIDGGNGVGTIDKTGLYTAPKKGWLASGTTEIIVATAADDVLRKAFARVTLVGRGPETASEPRIEIVPKHVCLYFQNDPGNDYIDWSNRCQLFKVEFHGTPKARLLWTISGNPIPIETLDPWLLYDAPVWPGAGVYRTNLPITASLKDDPQVFDTATVLVVKYVWPPLT